MDYMIISYSSTYNFLFVWICEFQVNHMVSVRTCAGDTLVGEASRVVVAEACIQALEIPCTLGQTYEVNSVEVSIRFQ
jgi:hypothetical protein